MPPGYSSREKRDYRFLAVFLAAFFAAFFAFLAMCYPPLQSGFVNLVVLTNDEAVRWNRPEGHDGLLLLRGLLGRLLGRLLCLLRH